MEPRSVGPDRVARTRSRFFRLLGLRDTLGLVFYETSGVLTDDDWWAYWKGVLMDELPGLIGHEMLLTTPEGMSLCRVEQICNGQTLVEGIGPAPF